mmetsp:Transcript_38281/g.80551  ORF Transcript_38281/g.80551 Transcript_38281/m.80551 type:complete len:140 (-) Transcript_38281:443-862(-)|eukprot:CAMPEP_0183736092 /NCGR_PEP_ID=MMETSP0737-20130205/48466_1 /TAXON_ID=385413 /ORGANISM="Thalassiosira miniscula, Strain CCMP1093" /LENGTH=139 /DNA_ID=CAMNT_0025970011 /DNA_START=156 /DNA_END=575 /DNA_ORIENTATION=+
MGQSCCRAICRCIPCFRKPASDSNHGSLEAVGLVDGDGKLQAKIVELERINADLKGQLISANGKEMGTLQVEMATLKSEMDTLREGKQQLEWQLTREKQKSKQRTEGAKQRRQALKDKLSGFKDTLTEDKVAMSYNTVD